MDSFYHRVLRRLVAEGRLDPTAATLVVAGGAFDAEVLADLGFTEATISNLDARPSEAVAERFAWAQEDAEALSFADRSFDQVFVHAGLHHCASPHRALAEMYRVSARAVLVFEARDGLLMRLAVRLGLTDAYEVEAVIANDGRAGGVRNSAVPNHVYRWTEREVAKTVASLDPTGPPQIRYFYGLRLPIERLRMARARHKLLAARLLSAVRLVFTTVLPRQGNQFAFLIERPKQTWPWIDAQGEFNHAWAAQHYRLGPPDQG
ncbi:MAG: methyltransferase domain-containing protein [Rhodothalassiaceae bacterium]